MLGCVTVGEMSLVVAGCWKVMVGPEPIKSGGFYLHESNFSRPTCPAFGCCLALLHR